MGGGYNRIVFHQLMVTVVRLGTSPRVPLKSVGPEQTSRIAVSVCGQERETHLSGDDILAWGGQ